MAIVEWIPLMESIEFDKSAFSQIENFESKFWIHAEHYELEGRQRSPS